jgi:hypothetical protein
LGRFELCLALAHDRENGCAMKPINPWPMIAMLVVVIFLYLWLNGYLT